MRARRRRHFKLPLPVAVKAHESASDSSAPAAPLAAPPWLVQSATGSAHVVALCFTLSRYCLPALPTAVNTGLISRRLSMNLNLLLHIKPVLPKLCLLQVLHDLHLTASDGRVILNLLLSIGTGLCGLKLRRVSRPRLFQVALLFVGNLAGAYPGCGETDIL